MELKVKDDLLWGVKAIAVEIGRPERWCYYQLERGYLPAGKSGQLWVASRQALREYFQKLTTSRRIPNDEKSKQDNAAADRVSA